MFDNSIIWWSFYIITNVEKLSAQQKIIISHFQNARKIKYVYNITTSMNIKYQENSSRLFIWHILKIKQKNELKWVIGLLTYFYCICVKYCRDILKLEIHHSQKCPRVSSFANNDKNEKKVAIIYFQCKW